MYLTVGPCISIDPFSKYSPHNNRKFSVLDDDFVSILQSCVVGSCCSAEGVPGSTGGPGIEFADGFAEFNDLQCL